MKFFCMLVILSLLLSLVFGQIIDISERYDMKRENAHSFGAPLIPIGGRISDWRSSGDVILDSEKVALTQNEKSRTGGLVNEVPLSFPEWEIYMQIEIGNELNVGADGMGLWVVNNGLNEGPIWGGPSRWNGLLFAFDTFDNDRNYDAPLISLLQNNNDWDYPPGTDPGATNRQAASCQVNYRNRVLEVRVALFNNQIQLLYKMEGAGSWSLCFQAPLTVSLNRPVIGLTAATGDISDFHSVSTLQTRRLTPKTGSPSMTPPSNGFTGRDVPGKKHGFNAEVEIVQELRTYQNRYPGQIKENREEIRQQLIQEHKAEDINTAQYYDKSQQQQQQQYQPPPQQQQQQYQPPPQQQQQQQYQTQGFSSQDLEMVKSNQQYIINTLNSLSQQVQSTKDNLVNLENKINNIPRGSSGSQSGGDISRLKSQIEEFDQKTTQIMSSIRNLDVKFDRTTENSNRFHQGIKTVGNDVTQALANAAPSSFGYWFYFILTQVIFAMAWFWFTKSNTRSHRNF